MKPWTKRILWLILALLVWFLPVCYAFLYFGERYMKASVDHLLGNWMAKPGTWSRPPDGDFYTGYTLLRLAGTSPFFNSSAWDKVAYYVHETSCGAHYTTGVLAGRVPFELDEEQRRAWQRFIDWYQERSDSFTWKCSSFDRPALGMVEGVFAVGDDKALLYRGGLVPMRFTYIELVDATGKSLWTAEVPKTQWHFQPANLVAAGERYLVFRSTAQGESCQTLAFELGTEKMLWQQPADDLAEENGSLLKVPFGKSLVLDEENDILVELWSRDDPRQSVLVGRKLGSGEVLYRKALGSYLYQPGLRRRGRHLMIGHSGGVLVLDITTGEIERTVEVQQDTVFDRYCVGGDSIFYPEADALVRYRLADGSVTRMYSTGPLVPTYMCGIYQGQLIMVLAEGLHGKEGLAIHGIDLDQNRPRWKVALPDAGLHPGAGAWDICRYYPENTHISGELPRFVPLLVGPKVGRIWMFDLDSRRVVSKSQPGLLTINKDFFRHGSRFYLTEWDEPLIAIDGTTGEVAKAVRFEKSWRVPGPLPHVFGGNHLWMESSGSWGVLDAATLALRYTEEEPPKVEDRTADHRFQPEAARNEVQ